MINHKFMNKKGFQIIGLVILIFIIAILFSMARPNIHRSTRGSRQKLCYSNIRVLTGAAEIYNTDVKEEELMKSLDIKHLIKTKYLKDEPAFTEKECSYCSEYIEEEGLCVWCKYHGDLYGYVEGDYWKDR